MHQARARLRQPALQLWRCSNGDHCTFRTPWESINQDVGLQEVALSCRHVSHVCTRPHLCHTYTYPADPSRNASMLASRPHPNVFMPAMQPIL